MKNTLPKEEKREQFKKLALPMIKFLNDNYHPHTHVVVDSNRAELSEGLIAFTTEEYTKD